MSTKKNHKSKTVNFYHIEGKEENISKIDNLLKDTYKRIKNHKTKEIETIDIQGNKYYINTMSKAYVEDTGQKSAWLINISKLDPSMQIEIGDLNKEIEKRNEPLPISDNQGSVVDTQFLYDPQNHVCAFARTPGGMNKALLKTFLVRFCKVRGITLAVIPDEVAIESLDKLKETTSITYSIAKVNNLPNLENAKRSELQDIDYANEIGANKMTMILQAEDKMSLKGVINKAKILFANSEQLGIKKLKLEGTDNDGVFEPIDLLQHKVDYHGSVEFVNLITIRNMFDFLEVAYHSQYKYFNRIFLGNREMNDSERGQDMA